MKKEVSLNDFLKDTIIQFGEIKDKYPYYAFLLISDGIEFLGKCIYKDNFLSSNKNKKNFVRR